MNFDNIEVGDHLLIRSEASEKLKEWFGQAGHIGPACLAKYAVTGDGPPYLKIGRRVAYRERDLFKWAVARARLVPSTSASGLDL